MILRNRTRPDPRAPASKPETARRTPPRRAACLTLTFTAGLLAFLLAACSPNRGAIVGKWQGTDPTDVMEFRADGTFHIAGEDAYDGKYSFGGERLALKLDGDMGKALGKMSARVVIEGDTMKFYDTDGTMEVYKRAK